MGRGTYRFDQKKSKGIVRQAHPVWRGIGCVMLLLIPLMAYAAADLFVAYNQKSNLLPLPADIYKQVEPINQVIPGMNRQVNIGFGGITWADVAFTFIFWLLGMGVFSFVYALFYSMMAPPRYIGYDSPPVGRYRPPKDVIRRR
jgi:hypothetical protein